MDPEQDVTLRRCLGIPTAGLLRRSARALTDLCPTPLPALPEGQ